MRENINVVYEKCWSSFLKSLSPESSSIKMQYLPNGNLWLSFCSRHFTARLLSDYFISYYFFGTVSKTCQGLQALTAVTWSSGSTWPWCWRCSYFVLSQQPTCRAHSLNGAASGVVFPPGECWEEQPAVSVDRHMWACISWTACPASFSRIQHWWDTSSTAQWTHCAIQAWGWELPLVLGAAPTCLTPPRAQEESGTMAWEDPTHQLSSGGCTSALSPWLGTAEPMLAKPRHSVLATDNSHSSGIKSPLFPQLQQHTQKIPWAEAFLPCSQMRNPTGMEEMGENFLCVPLVSSQH